VLISSCSGCEATITHADSFVSQQCDERAARRDATPLTQETPPVSYCGHLLRFA
jgi:hypothetical protein